MGLEPYLVRERRDFFPVEQDAVVFVDDWKGQKPGQKDSPVCFYARAFLRSDKPTYKVLEHCLGESGAVGWHRRDLLFSESFPIILNTLDHDAALTKCFMALWEYGEIKEPVVDRFFSGLVGLRTELPEAWKFENPLQRALFLFLGSLGTKLWKCGIESAVIVCDRFMEFKEPVKKQAVEEDGFCRFLYSDPTNVVNGEYMVMIPIDKKRQDVVPYLPWLNLVDGELWIIQKAQTTPLSDNTTIWDRAIRWRNMGCPGDFELFRKADEKVMENLLELPSFDEEDREKINKRFLDYISKWMDWCNRGICMSISVNHKDNLK